MPSLFCEWVRWWDSPYINHFLQPDTIIPDPSNPQSWNRYSYVQNNPVRFSDPTGHMVSDDDDGGVASSGCLPSEIACQLEKSERYKAHKERQRQDKLIPLMFDGSGPNGSWTYADQYQYYTSRATQRGLWANPERWDNSGLTGWELFSLHAGKLASHYSSDQKDQFVRDFGLVFGGIPSQPSFGSAAMSVKNGPGQLSILNYSNDGLASQYLDKNQESNQSHHYAGIFVLGYFADSEAASVVNFMRDTDNPGDIALGNVAAGHGSAFSISGPMSQISQYISSLHQ